MHIGYLAVLLLLTPNSALLFEFKIALVLIMISAQVVVETGIEVPSSSVLHPKVYLRKGSGNVSIGERNVIEECVALSGSSLGDNNLIEVGSVIKNVSLLVTD